MEWIIAGLALLGALAYGAFGLDWDEDTFINAAFAGVAALLVVGRLIRGAWL